MLDDILYKKYVVKIDELEEGKTYIVYRTPPDFFLKAGTRIFINNACAWSVNDPSRGFIIMNPFWQRANVELVNILLFQEV